ncbi:hypothetical protein C2E23DRAFT_230462 [Lenzites betulinus]|nr:hypothetical protein C2E23DRAFT_230462 [Lenzites betulinus]
MPAWVLRTVVLAYLLIAAHTLAMRVPRAAISPSIISPSGLSQWPSGTVQTIKWVSDQDLTGLNGTIYIGYVQSSGDTFLWKDQPLGENFPLSDGVVNVRIPLNLPTGGRYVVSLSVGGDDGDISAVFAIIDRTVTLSTTLAPPATLLITGEVPSATITLSSVISTLGLPTSTLLSDASTQPPTTPTGSTGKPPNTAGVIKGLGTGSTFLIALSMWIFM